MSPFREAKLYLASSFHLHQDALHIYVALILFLGSAGLFRWPLKSWKPWLVVLFAALAGEVWDLRDSLTYHRPLNLRANAKDIVNTLFWPTILMMLARATKILARR
jgi:hypothetical protein